jgi:hypothetical protein
MRYGAADRVKAPFGVTCSGAGGERVGPGALSVGAVMPGSKAPTTSTRKFTVPAEL